MQFLVDIVVVILDAVPIYINLLVLIVVTSPICVDIVLVDAIPSVIADAIPPIIDDAAPIRVGSGPATAPEGRIAGRIFAADFSGGRGVDQPSKPPETRPGARITGRGDAYSKVCQSV